MFRHLLLAGALAAGTAVTLAAPRAAHAQAGDAPSTYAIVIGSNAGGPGQDTLRYAEDDARKVAQVLVELGGVSADRVDVIVHPTPDVIRARLDHLAELVAADAAAGHQSRVVFYYSGHARAQAIDLGADELPLDELRKRLFDVKATLTVVVLDACQSGAFARVKGAAPAADFSYSSREHLDASGVAVLASSSGSELSQESEQLRGSYFTHNLLVGLRGAGDANGDGQVTLDEAYQYAYHQTLLATAETAVGSQHVTFEADLKGHGEVALSFPRAATAAIELPAAMEGTTLVEDTRAKVVVAETYKAKGAAVRIAVAPGDYRVLVRSGNQLARCDVGSDGSVDMARCQTETLEAARPKGGSLHELRVEIDGLAGGERDDGYTQNLTAFGYNQALGPSAGLQALAIKHVAPYVWVGGLASEVGLPSWTRATGAETQELDWSMTTLDVVGRGEVPIGSDGALSRLALYGQVGAGLALGHAHFSGAEGESNSHTYAGYAFTAGAGVHFDFRHQFGVSAGYQFDYAPAIDDRIGNTHAAGGHRLLAGLSYGF
jgi:hypothetical protein|nr:caspase family protein [Kofleriaceae bacterium]